MPYLLDPEALAAGVETPYLDDKGEPVQAPHGGFGKWRIAGIPHEQWDWIADPVTGRPWVSDLGAIYSFDSESGRRSRIGGDHAICQMCEKEPIRFGHHLEHPDYIDDRLGFRLPLVVGCNCAGFMTGKPDLARDLEKLAHDRAKLNAKAIQIADGAEWSIDNKGRHRAQFRSMWLTVMRDGAGWRARYWHRPTRGTLEAPYSRESKQRYSTVREARRRAVAAALVALKRKPWRVYEDGDDTD